MPVMVASPLELTDWQRAELEAMARSSVLSHRQVVQARALLFGGGGHRQRGDRAPLRYDDGHGAPVAGPPRPGAITPTPATPRCAKP